MGNIPSSNLQQFIENFEEKIIKIFREASWQDMQNMENPQECDKILALTTKIFYKHLSSREIDYLAHRIKHGETKMIRKNKVNWIKKDELDKLNNSKNKKLICQGIAKFYIKIANVFFAVVKTINPQYVLNDINNTQQKIPLLEYGKLPKDVEKKLKLFGFCQNRINALKYKTNQDKTITVFPSPCELIQKKYRDEHGKCITKYKTFGAEPGVPELKNLYKDIYNYDPRAGKPGKYTKLSKEALKQYRYDLKQFYRAFTGKQLPDKIKSFSQIKLSDYSCKYDPRIKCSKKTRPHQSHDPSSYKPITLDISTRTNNESPPPPMPRDAMNSPTTSPTPSPMPTPTMNSTTSRPMPPPPMNSPPPPPMPSTPMNSPTSMPSTAMNSPTPMPPHTQVGGVNMSIRHQPYTGSLDDELFSKYANHLARMIGYAQQNQQKLVQVLEKIFVEDGKNVLINPKLDLNMLQKITDETRNTIVKLYIKCEEDFRKGLELFDDIIKQKQLQKINRQEKLLKKKLNDVLNN